MKLLLSCQGESIGVQRANSGLSHAMEVAGAAAIRQADSRRLFACKGYRTMDGAVPS